MSQYGGKQLLAKPLQLTISLFRAAGGVESGFVMAQTQDGQRDARQTGPLLTA